MSQDLRWRELERAQIADCRVFKVESSLAVSPVDGSRHTYYRLQSNDWVQILPITAAQQAVLVRQYRHGNQRVTLEVPAGLVEPGEDPAAAALRECMEETGYRGRSVRSLGVVYPNPALFANRLHGFVAVDVELAGAIQNTGTEHTEVALVPVAELPQMLMSGAIDHALNAAFLWRYLWEHHSR
jgi:8-oxo-dGTP pyrophosphatase MutT (NUDIX family)